MCHPAPFYQNCKRTRIGHQAYPTGVNVEQKIFNGELVWIVRCEPAQLNTDEAFSRCFREIHWQPSHIKDRWPSVEVISHCPYCEAGNVEDDAEVAARKEKLQPLREGAPGNRTYNLSRERMNRLDEKYWGMQVPPDERKEFGASTPLTEGNLGEFLKGKKKGAVTGDTDDEDETPAKKQETNWNVKKLLGYASTSVSSDSAALMPPPPKKHKPF